MIIGVPGEVKPNEYRVGLTPACADTLVRDGHTVTIERGAGLGSGFADADYRKVGAKIVARENIFARSELIIKVKEPQKSEFRLFQPGQQLFCFLHLAAEPKVTEALLKKRVTALAIETVELPDGSLPLLKPMSQVAGKLAVQLGMTCLQREKGGEGILLGGVPGVAPGIVTILGGGTVGTNAARVALGLGAFVNIFDKDLGRLERLEELFEGRVRTLYPYPQKIAEAVAESDLVIGAVLVSGARAPVIVSRKMVKSMRPGSVIVDVAVDQGGCIATTRPTSHAQPTYTTYGVIHCNIPNMPGIVPRTSAIALTMATLPYIREVATAGMMSAAAKNEIIAGAINTHDGVVTYPAVGAALKKPVTHISKFFQ